LIHPLVGVDHAVLGGVADRRAAEEVRGERDVEQLAPGATGHAVDLLGDPAGDLVARRNPGGVGFAVALLACHPAESQLRAFGERRDRVVQMLHHQRDHGPLTPVADVEHAKRAARILARVAEELPPPRNVRPLRACAVGHQRLQ
jgi:hypothetical protein